MESRIDTQPPPAPLRQGQLRITQEQLAPLAYPFERAAFLHKLLFCGLLEIRGDTEDSMAQSVRSRVSRGVLVLHEQGVTYASNMVLLLYFTEVRAGDAQLSLRKSWKEHKLLRLVFPDPNHWCWGFIHIQPCRRST